MEGVLIVTEKEKLLGDLFRDAIYSANTVHELLELFSKKIPQNFGAEDFLILQMASQLYESAQIRKVAKQYMDMQSAITTECFKLITEKHPTLRFCVSQRFKSAKSELYKRCERISEEQSPEIKDLVACRIIILEEENQETLKHEYEIVQDTMEHFSVLNSAPKFPLLLNLSIPDKLVTPSGFSPEEHPNIIIPDETTVNHALCRLGKDYIVNPKKHGYQAFHSSYELVCKNNTSQRIFSEIQVTTISQHNYEPANHEHYKKKRNEKWDKVFSFDKSKVHISGYYPEFNSDYSGLMKPLYIVEEAKTY